MLAERGVLQPYRSGWSSNQSQQCFLMGAAGGAMTAMRAIRAVIQSGFGLTDADASAMQCQYLDEEGDFCTLNRLTLAHWTQ